MDKLVLYSDMLLARLSERKIQRDWFEDNMKTPAHLGIGQEGIVAGVVNALPESTQYFATYRNHPLYLIKSKDLDGFFGEMYGRETGYSEGVAGSMHLMNPDEGVVCTSAVVGTTIPVAMGYALANKIKKNDQQVCVFFGDGAMDEGVFWETINFASLHQLKVLFVCEDNGLAIHTFKKDRTGYDKITSVMKEFRICVAETNGTDAQNVYQNMNALVEQCREKNQPGFMYVPYFRFNEHVGVAEDYQMDYRKVDMFDYDGDPYIKLDPLTKLENELIGELGEEKVNSIKSEIDTRVENAMKAAFRAKLIPADDVEKHVYAEE